MGINEEIEVIKEIISVHRQMVYVMIGNDEFLAFYKQLEEAMENKSSEYYSKYEEIRKPNLHKMKPIPVCEIPKEYEV